MEYQTVEQSSKYKTVLMKGAPGSGKTFKAAHFPRPVFFNFDHNLTGLNKLPEDVKKHIKVLDPAMKNGKKIKGRGVWDNFTDLLTQVVADPDTSTVVIDSLTTLQEYLMDKILGSESPDTQMKIQDWGTICRYWKTLGEELLCAPDLDKHVVFIAHERTIEDDTSGVKMTRFGLNIGGSRRETFDLYFSDVWRCYVDLGNKGIKYMVAVEPKRTFTAKSTLANMKGVFEWDEQKTELLKQL